MKSSFNLRKHLQKKAFYEGAQELMRTDRKMMDCQRAYLEQGKGAQEAWFLCQEKYDNKGKDGSYLE
jgi:hypothetical protein